MKKFNVFVAAATLVAGFGSSAAFAVDDLDDVVLGGAYVVVAPLARDINNAQQGRMVAQPARAGFVKNSFDFTISANVVMAAEEDVVNNRFGVVAGSNKGYVTFTGSSVGGSIAQCGDPADKNADENLAAKFVTADSLDLDEANGCGR